MEGILLISLGFICVLFDEPSKGFRWLDTYKDYDVRFKLFKELAEFGALLGKILWGPYFINVLFPTF